MPCRKELLLTIKERTYALDVIRPPRLNFLPFKTLAGTIGADGCIDPDGTGDDVVAENRIEKQR